MARKLSAKQDVAFRQVVWSYYQKSARDLLWRKTRNPYKITVSELMLQQTQVDRVVPKYESFLKKFPSWRVLSSATLSDVLREWSGLGYNRRAKLLHQLAQVIVKEYKGSLPIDYDQLIKLPGIGPATAAAIRAFAFNLPGVYLETNVRSVYLHHFFKDQKNISDKQLIPLIEQTQDTKNPREWNWALLDYGAHIKKTFINPNRQSKHYTRQSKFKGSNRELRGKILRILLSRDTLILSRIRVEAGEPDERVAAVLEQLCAEGMISKIRNMYRLVH
jgi:A/G-specific adenine glycosylase